VDNIASEDTARILIQFHESSQLIFHGINIAFFILFLWHFRGVKEGCVGRMNIHVQTETQQQREK
jgi:hypothetical protein